MSQVQRPVARSKVISPFEYSPVRKWMTKNGLPPVFSRTSRASGAASAAERWTVSATSRSTSFPPSGREGDLPHDGAAGPELVERRRQRLRGGTSSLR